MKKPSAASKKAPTKVPAKRTGPKAKPGSLVEVTWEDAYSTAGWCDSSHSPAMVISIGFAVFDNNDGIMLAHGHAMGEFLGKSFIPKGMVRSVKKIK